MRINQNISAMNTYSRLTGANNSKSRSLEKLSSGLRINRAGDDAAGLAISEKMRGQVGGLKQAVRNAQDGISLIQTAEGALNETHSILGRMRDLAVQSSSDTNTESDRAEIQKEMDQLAGEMTRISNTTEFNTKNLLDGQMTKTVFHIGANSGQNIELGISAMDAYSLGVASDKATVTLDDAAAGISGAKINGTPGTGLTEGTDINVSVDATAREAEWTAGDLGITGTTLKSTDETSEYNDYKIIVTKTGTTQTDVQASIDKDAKTITINYDVDVTAANATAIKLQDALDGAGIKLTATGDATAVVGNAGADADVKGFGADEVELTVGSETQIVKNNIKSTVLKDAIYNGLTINFDDVLAATTEATITIGSDKASAANGDDKAEAPAGIDVTSQEAADAAITVIDEATAKVSEERSKLGSIQNRLDHTINNLTATAENLSAAESRIRDVDMAEEMMEFTKNNILSQAATSMLAQANQMPQSVLQLLQ